MKILTYFKYAKDFVVAIGLIAIVGVCALYAWFSWEYNPWTKSNFQPGVQVSHSLEWISISRRSHGGEF